MSVQADVAVQDLENLYPRIRNNLTFTFHIIKSVACYVIEDPVNSRYYRVGVNEYKFISLLNGHRSVAEAMRIMADTLGEDALMQNEVVQILHWLGSVKLLDTNQPHEDDNMLGFSAGVAKLLFPKVPFGNPNKILDKMLPLARLFLGKGFFVIWLVVVLYAIYVVFSQWSHFASTANRILSVNNWWHLALVWVVLKIIHELWHALVCKYHNADVRETGILFILFIPMGYVDASSCWNLPSKWKRIHVAFAGMKIELFIAAVAAIIWNETSAGVVNQVCYEIVLMASLTTLFFNANPLMRFDGYYALADYLEEVNLYSRAQYYLKYLGRRYLLGITCSFSEASIKTRLLLFVYGVCAFLWRIVIYASIALATSLLFLGAGIALSILYFFVFVVLPLAKLFYYMLFGKGLERPSLWRSAIIICGVAYFIHAIFSTLTWEKSIETSGIVVYQKQETIRVYCPGFVRKMYVKTGQFVKRGQKLLLLENKEARADYEQLLLAIEETNLKIRQFRQQDLVKEKIEKEKLKYLKKRRVEQRNLLETLTLYSPIDGFIETRRLHDLVGAYLKTGDEVMNVFDPKTKELLIAIHQDDIDEYRILLRRNDLHVYIPSIDKEFQGELDNISPTATTTIIHPALTAVGGGDIVVRNDPQGNYHFVAPYFRADIFLPAHGALKCGHRGYVRIYGKQKTIGMHIYYILEDWVQNTWNQNS
ncbi:peptidase M50 [Candidatus Uabimicrobium amorphum]|uniref:Peptidase M50 n=2 Tax=Uabimicrobium amorphum TaxID=2596890 RepID=A0A5S9IPF8_UABAM|nr:peptidase M50 [Candidatus Uabimicrobium amorphum]